MNKEELIKKMGNIVKRNVKHYKSDFFDYDIPTIEKWVSQGFKVEKDTAQSLYENGGLIYREDGSLISPSYYFSSHAAPFVLFNRATEGYKGKYYYKPSHITWIVRDSGTHIVLDYEKDYMEAIKANWAEYRRYDITRNRDGYFIHYSK